MSQSWSDTLEHAARAAMVAEYREPPAARRTRSEWLIAVPAMAFVAAIVAFVLLGWATRA